MVESRRLAEAHALLRGARYAVALTGAGMSTASGIPDFRGGESGLWRTHDPLEVATIGAFRRHPERFYDWIRPVADVILGAEPNVAHVALRDLERYGPLRSVVTQNIDLLHGRAGSEVVRELHGHLREMVCLGCEAVFESVERVAGFVRAGGVPLCERCGAVLKPNVILFGEALPAEAMRLAELDILRCDVLLVAGSSLEVAPVSQLPMQAIYNGARVIVVNREPTHVDDFAAVVLRGDVTDVLPRLAAPFLPSNGS